MEFWPKLQELFPQDWPKHFQAYEVLKNQYRLEKEGKISGTKVYILDDDWSDGTFILQDAELYTVIYTLDEKCKRLREALLLLDWSKGPRIHPYLGRFKVALNSVYEELKLPVLYDGDMLWHWIHRDTAINFNVEHPEAYVDQLKEFEADYINQFWPHKYEGSENWLRSLIRKNISKGVYLKSNNKLVAWVLRMDSGIITSLHTHPDYVRKGFGALALKAIAKAIAEQGSDSVGCIVNGNYRSTALFDKLGFTSQGPMHWSKTAPFKTSTNTYSRFIESQNTVARRESIK
ncbi:uncharacterized protein LOC113368093 [Ctenocephalides felis]|uniref:uncharacterized protein LOC113368093 n=1 Tax=Ctenocephalides felis TaxID=7515 RepID=UPI000E6E2E20|nr:uncharacterized protein LOC113368093 [Ctenocephalides felis]